MIMQTSLSASGPKQSALIALGHQREAAVEQDPASQPVVDAVIAHVSQSLEGVPSDASVTVSASVSVIISKPQG
jgi:hypothetical protein